jgi:hypothetical protein
LFLTKPLEVFLSNPFYPVFKTRHLLHIPLVWVKTVAINKQDSVFSGTRLTLAPAKYYFLII